MEPQPGRAGSRVAASGDPPPTGCAVPCGTNILIVTRDHLAVWPGAILTDVQEVTQASPQTPEALRLLDAELLEDLEGVGPHFDAWLQAERKQLRSRALRIAELILREVNDPDEAVEAAERVLTIDRAHEGAWRALMNVHDARGERGLAIQTYNRCRAALAHSADAMPSAKTQKLFDEIRGASHSQVLPRPTSWSRALHCSLSFVTGLRMSRRLTSAHP